LIAEKERQLAKDKVEMELQCERKVGRYREFSQELEGVNKELIGKCEQMQVRNKELERLLKLKSDEVNEAQTEVSHQV
jgi:hypothetical protein